MDDVKVLIVGDGPTGLSAALILAKTGFAVEVIGSDETPVRKAMLHNYAGVEDLEGPAFMAHARRQAESFGARLHKAKVERVEMGERIQIETGAGRFEGTHLVIATGFDATLAKTLDLARGEGGAIHVDMNGRTSQPCVYAGGAAVRGMKSQLATSVGDGAAIAVDILSEARGKPSHDYDVLKAKPREQAV